MAKAKEKQPSPNGQLQPTPASEWRKPREEGHPYRLPSGRVAMLAPVSIMSLMRAGKIPDPLTPFAASLLYEEKDIEELAKEPEMAKASFTIAEAICMAAFRDPIVVEEPQAENEISLDDLDDMDKAWVMQVMIQPLETLRKFRRQQARSVEAIPDGEGDGDEAQPADSD